MFKKFAVLAALSVLAVTPALASSCPTKMAAIDAALANGTEKKMQTRLKKLRAKGGQLYKAGKHSDSIRFLVQAMLLAGISESSY